MPHYHVEFLAGFEFPPLAWNRQHRLCHTAARPAKFQNLEARTANHFLDGSNKERLIRPIAVTSPVMMTN
jgi:hypothetical protein